MNTVIYSYIFTSITYVIFNALMVKIDCFLLPILQKLIGNDNSRDYLVSIEVRQKYCNTAATLLHIVNINSRIGGHLMRLFQSHRIDCMTSLLL